MLRGIKYCTGEHVYDDDDLNVFIDPDPSYAQLAKNRARIVVQLDGYPLGVVEGELRTMMQNFPALDEWNALFPVNTHVMAQGWWVEDSGHDDKTELHPLRQMYGPVDEAGRPDSSFSLFVAQDTSGRFERVTKDPVEMVLPVRMPPAADVIRPDNGDGGGLATAGVARERRYRNAHIRDFTRSEGGTLLIHLVTGTEDGGNESFRLSRFDVGEEKVFQDDVTYGLHGVGSSSARAEITVKPRFTDTYLNAYHSLFELTSSSGARMDATNGTYTLIYSPSQNLLDSSWSLFATAVTSHQLNPGLDANRHAYGQKARIYKIEPSSISLTVDSPDLNPTKLQDPSQRSPWGCVFPRSVTASESLLSGVSKQADSFKWSIRITDYAQPLGALGAAWIEVTRNAPFVSGGLTASLDPANDHVMWFSTPSSILNAPPAVSVRAMMNTNLGESPVATVDIQAACFPGTDPLDVFIENVWKGMAAVEKLRRAGRLPARPTVDLASVKGIVRRAGNVSIQIGEPYKITRRLPSEFAGLADDFFQFLEGRTPPRASMEKLGVFANGARGAVWSTPLPPDFLRDASRDPLVPKHSPTPPDPSMPGPPHSPTPPDPSMPGPPHP